MINTTVKVYVYRIKHDYLSSINWFNKYRLRQIDQCLNNAIRQQKIYSWLLLNYALQKEFKYDIVKQKNFKLINKCFWKYKNYFFSITHRDEYVAIAISMHKIGVDLELFNKKLFKKNIWNRITSKNKNLKYSPLSCLILWIKNEAFFKQASSKYIAWSNKKNDEEVTVVNIKSTKIWLAITCNKKNLKLVIDI